MISLLSMSSQSNDTAYDIVNVTTTAVVDDVANTTTSNSSIGSRGEGVGSVGSHGGTAQTTTLWTAYLSATCLWVIFVVGLLGNLFVLSASVLQRERLKKHAVTWLFICSLTFSDLGMVASVTWVQALISISPNWTYGTFLCQLSSMWRSFSSNCSMWTVAIIASDKYLGLRRPGNAFLSVRAAQIVIVVTWILNLAFSVPSFVWASIARQGPIQFHCGTSNAGTISSTIFSYFTNGINYFMPLGLTWFAYVGIIVKMKMSQRKNNASSQSASLLSKKVITMCLLSALAVSITWTPFKVGLLFVIAAASLGRSIPSPLLPALTVIACLNAALNPFIYGIMWKPLRKAINESWASCWRKRASVKAVSINVQPKSVTRERTHATLALGFATLDNSEATSLSSSSKHEVHHDSGVQSVHLWSQDVITKF